MIRKIVSCVLVASVLLSCGCSSSEQVSAVPGGGLSLEAFNVEAYDRSAGIVFRDGTESDARNVVARPDSVYFSNEATGTMTVVPTHSIRKIILRNHWIGWLEGFGWGALIGASTVAVLVGTSPSHGGEFSGSGWALFFAALGAGAGGVIGGFPGLIIGHSYEYDFSKIPDVKTK